MATGLRTFLYAILIKALFFAKSASGGGECEP